MSVIVTLSADEIAWSEGDLNVQGALAYCKAQRLNSVKDLASNVKIQVATSSYAKLRYDAKRFDPQAFFVLILSVYNQFQIIGYMPGHDCIQGEWYSPKDLCHYVPQRNLVQIYHCPCEIPMGEADDIVF